MNTVSWMLYLTSVIPTLGSIGFGLMVILGLALTIMCVLYFTSLEFGDSDAIKMRKGLIHTLKFISIPFSVAFMFAVLAPDQKTMYMIAASELGEEILVSDEAKTLYNDIRDILQSYKKEESSK